MINSSFIFCVVSFILLVFIWILVKSIVVRPVNQGYFKTVYKEWIEFSMRMGEVVWTIVSAIVFFTIAPFFVFIFLKPKDVLATKLDKESYWEKPKEVSFDLKRNYRQY